MPQVPGHRPLHPDDFSLCGFGEYIEPIHQSIRSVSILSGKPTAATIESCTYVPATRQRGQAPNYLGGIVNDSGVPLDTINLRRRGKKMVGGLIGHVAAAPKASVDEQVVYLGWMLSHYGHFLLESMARAWVLNEIGQSVRVLFHAPTGLPEAKAILRILEGLGITQERLIIPDEPTRFHRLLIPEPLYEIGFAAHERAADAHRDLAARILSGSRSGISGQPVYLSRRLLSSDRREVVGERELEEILKENGFLIAHPEKMDLEDQVRLFNRHTHIFGSDGSALHGLLFSLQSPRIHFLAAQAVSPDYFLTSFLCGSKASFIYCLGDGGLENFGRQSPQIVEVDRIVSYLRELGFLKSRSRSTLAARLPDTRDRFAESWHFARVRTATHAREKLPEETELAAIQISKRSWPISFALARYFATRDPSRVEDMTAQFLNLISAECDLDRLARYHAYVEKWWPRLAANVKKKTARHLLKLLHDRFSLEVQKNLRATSNA